MITKIFDPESKMCMKEEKGIYKRNTYLKAQKFKKSYKSPVNSQYQLHTYLSVFRYGEG